MMITDTNTANAKTTTPTAAAKITTILFDLDGTLLPMDLSVFVEAYFAALATALEPHGYEFQTMVDGIWACTRAVMNNSGGESNEEVYWKNFAAIFGDRVYADRPVFDAFYEHTFDSVAASCGYDPRAAEVIRRVKAKGLRTVLATNPIFPAAATRRRVVWAGVDIRDFELCTTFENSCHCKPNLDYYRDILRTLDVQPEACVMVGNDVGEDMIAEQLGMRVFLMTDCLINRNNADISGYPQGGFDDLLAFIDSIDPV